jgi:cyclopropane fatty-acyl-phospholipid synthase-like methyltransferase
MKTVITSNDERTMRTMLREHSEKDPSKFAMNLLKPKSYVLSAGCGAGREVDYLVNTLKCKVVAIDIDENAVKLSKEKIPNAEYLVGDMVEKIFPKKFDYIVCLWSTINYLNRESRKKFIETCYENLKEGGELILGTTHIFSHWRHLLSNIKHKQHYHPFPWEINEWFKDTDFTISKKRIAGTILVFARK